MGAISSSLWSAAAATLSGSSNTHFKAIEASTTTLTSRPDLAGSGLPTGL
jgi:hypothetical protein